MVQGSKGYHPRVERGEIIPVTSGTSIPTTRGVSHFRLKEGFRTVCRRLEIDDRSPSSRVFDFQNALVWVWGNERGGVLGTTWGQEVGRGGASSVPVGEMEVW